MHFKHKIFFKVDKEKPYSTDNLYRLCIEEKGEMGNSLGLSMITLKIPILIIDL